MCGRRIRCAATASSMRSYRCSCVDRGLVRRDTAAAGLLGWLWKQICLQRDLKIECINNSITAVRATAVWPNPERLSAYFGNDHQWMECLLRCDDEPCDNAIQTSVGVLCTCHMSVNEQMDIRKALTTLSLQRSGIFRVLPHYYSRLPADVEVVRPYSSPDTASSAHSPGASGSMMSSL